MNIPILLYHSISDHFTSQYQTWSVSPARFDEHMAYLREHGYQPMTISAIVERLKSNGKGLPERVVAVTFDDGLADFLSGAVPVLQKYHFPATLFVATGFVGETSRWLDDLGEQDRPMLTWEQLAALENVEIGSHAHQHLQMDIVPLSRARQEIIRSKELLEQHLHRSIKTFAFPHGYHTKQLLNIVQNAGYEAACAVDHMMANHSDNVFALPRIIITSDVTTDILQGYLQGRGIRVRSFLRTPLKTIWRIVRRLGMDGLLSAAAHDYSRSR
jgi:peptidoglycan/xylan/chitin deacetylase (PgdA/CDA1 family)